MYPIHLQSAPRFQHKALEIAVSPSFNDHTHTPLHPFTLCPTETPVIVFDFETTGQAPKYGDRPIEVGAVRIEQGRIVDRFQSLMNPGFSISWFIESLTGISNDLVAQAPPCETVMAQFDDWIGDMPLVAHNVGFDRTFLDAELKLLGRERINPMACTVLTARRIFPQAPNHKLPTLVEYLGIANAGIFHRALADAEMTGHLWIAMTDLIRDRYGLSQVPFFLMQNLMRVARTKVDRYLHNFSKKQQNPGLF